MTAIFDMDGTLFAGDSQLRFVRWVLRRHGWRRLYLLLVAPGLLLRALGLLSTQGMKRLFLCYAWRMRREELMRECSAFVQQELLPAVYAPLRERLEQHQAAGDETVLCSASPEWWTDILGKQMGFTCTIATPVQLSGDRIPFMPCIPPPGNNRGNAKVERLAACGITRAQVGYTDSTADLPMLSICERAVLVNPSARFIHALPHAEVIDTGRRREHGLSFVLRCVFGLSG